MTCSFHLDYQINYENPTQLHIIKNYNWLKNKKAKAKAKS